MAEILKSWEEIKEVFEVGAEEVEIPDEYYPADENGFDESEVATIIADIRKLKPDIEICHEEDYIITYVKINSLEDHQVVFTALIQSVQSGKYHKEGGK